MVKLDQATVLVVDDEPDLRDMVAYEFELMGSRVFEAGDGDGALGIMESQKVDAVITDIRMSGCDGIHLLDDIRKRDARDPVVIFITAYDSDLSPFEAYHLGAEGIFAKPFSLKALVDNVQRALVPPEERLAAVPGLRPQRTITRMLPDLDQAQQAKLIAVGRGGLALALTDCHVMPGESIWLDLSFDGGPIPALQGSGLVRWIQQGPTPCAVRCGIEFEYLTDESRRYFIDWLATVHCTPYIPRI
jgi:DNA-binding response OmpR family regulator